MLTMLSMLACGACCMLQEGDSWTVAFSEAEDAVAFSLQASLRCLMSLNDNEVLFDVSPHYEPPIGP
jgi:hypothetical protein